MNIINITRHRTAVKNLIVVILTSGIFLALLLCNPLYADIRLVSPFVENPNSQELIGSDSRENETSKDE